MLGYFRFVLIRVSILLGMGDFCESASQFALFCHFRNFDNGLVGGADGSLVACSNLRSDDPLVNGSMCRLSALRLLLRISTWASSVRSDRGCDSEFLAPGFRLVRSPVLLLLRSVATALPRRLGLYESSCGRSLLSMARRVDCRLYDSCW